MGIEDILYDLIKEYRLSRLEKQKTKENEEKQIELAKSIVKKAYLRFNFEWNTEKNEEVSLDWFIRTKHDLFKYYSTIFLDIAVEIYDVLPEESEKLKNMAKGLKAGATYRTSKEIKDMGNFHSDAAMKYFQELNS
jgi:HD-GYP domain-containing protein (c-di-GMP phosphodiesterase class II)